MIYTILERLEYLKSEWAMANGVVLLRTIMLVFANEYELLYSCFHTKRSILLEFVHLN
jgi:hypothetical protein